MTKAKKERKPKNEAESDLELNNQVFELPSSEELAQMSEVEIIECLRQRPNTQSYVRNRELEMRSSINIGDFQAHGSDIEKEFYELAQYNPCVGYTENYFIDEQVDKATKKADLEKYNQLLNKLLNIKKSGNDKLTALIYKFVPVVMDMSRSYAKTKDATVIFYGRIITILLAIILEEKSKDELHESLKNYKFPLVEDVSYLADCILDYFEKIAWNFDIDRTAYTTAPRFYSYMCDVQYAEILEPMFTTCLNDPDINFNLVRSEIEYFIKESEYLQKHSY